MNKPCKLAGPLQITFLWMLFLSGSLHADPSLDDNGNNDLFEFRAEAVEALENGPLVIRLTYFYHGKTQTTIRLPRSEPYAKIPIPMSWEFSPGMRGNIGPIIYKTLIKPNQTWSEQICFQKDYKNIIAGEYPLLITWDVGGDHSKIHLQQKLVLKIAKATEENLKKMRARISEELRKDRLTQKELKDLLRQVMDTPHRESFWCMLEIMDYTGISYAESVGVANFGGSGFWNRPYDAVSPRAEIALSVMVEYLNRAEPGQAVTLIRQLPNNIPNPMRLPKSLVQSLCKAPNPFVRSLLYAQFPNDLEKAIIDRTLCDMRTLYDPPPKEHLQLLLNQCDDSSFRVREQATKDLICFGEKALPFLEQAERKPLSAEAAEQVKKIREQIRQSTPNRVGQSTLDALAELDTIESKQILQALSQNKNEGWAAKRAKAILENKK